MCLILNLLSYNMFFISLACFMIVFLLLSSRFDYFYYSFFPLVQKLYIILLLISHLANDYIMQV